jgi:hypothetical protein
MGHAEDLKAYEATMREARLQWPEGPWTNEPDRLAWETDGYPCLMVRSHVTGAWCGYVGLPPAHPFHGKDLVSINEGLLFPRSIDYAKGCDYVVCHAGEGDDVYWIGFQCAHAFDDCPLFHRGEPTRRARGVTRRGHPVYGITTSGWTYWDAQIVRAMVAALALELKAVQLGTRDR